MIRCFDILIGCNSALIWIRYIRSGSGEDPDPDPARSKVSGSG